MPRTPAEQARYNQIAGRFPSQSEIDQNGLIQLLRGLTTRPPVEDVGPLPLPAPIRGAGAQAVWDATDPNPMAAGLSPANFPGSDEGAVSGDGMPMPGVDWEAAAMRQLRAAAKPPSMFQAPGAPPLPADEIPPPPGFDARGNRVGEQAAAAAQPPAPKMAGSFSWSGGKPSEDQLGAERASFLSGGMSPEIGGMADAIRGRELAAENIARNRPDLYGAQMREDDMARSASGTPEGRATERQRLRDEGDIDMITRGLQRALTQRGIDVERGLTDAFTFMRPEAGTARYQQFEEGLNQYQNPRALQIQEHEFQQKLALAILDAYARMYGSPYGGVMGMPVGDLGKMLGLKTDVMPGAGGAGPAGAGGRMPAAGRGTALPASAPPDGGPATRKTRDGRTVVWDGQGWAYQE